MSSAPRRLDPSAPDPLFQQARDHLLDLVRRGVYAPGGRLPPERELARTLAISRLTLRVALNGLADEGVLQPSAGRGWFVSRVVSEPPGALMSFSRMVRAAGMAPSNRLLQGALRPATAVEAQALDRQLPLEVVELVRLRLIDGQPAAVEHSRLVIADGRELLSNDLDRASLYDLLEQRGISPASADFTISARVADRALADHLEIAEGAPLIVLDQVTHDSTGLAFELVEAIYRVDRYRFRGAFRAGRSAASTTPMLLEPSDGGGT